MATERVEVGLPEKFGYTRHSTRGEIVRRWSGFQALFMTAFAVIWNGFLLTFYSAASQTEDVPLVVFLFPLIHVGVGIGVAYYAIACWFNRTTISFSKGKIEVKHGPLPWMGNIEVPASDLKQLYSKERISRSKNGTSVTYQVQAVTRQGKTLTLITGLDESEQALYIEQEIEKFLGIEDAPVRGEIPR